MATQKSHRAANFAQAAVYTLIVLAILGVLNFLANRYSKSFDATANKKYTLSDQSAKIAKNLKDDVTITYWDQGSEGFTNAQGLFDRYKSLSTKITVEYQDAVKKRTEAIAAGVKTVPTILVKVGNKTETAKSLTEEEVTGAMVRALKGGDRTVCFVTGSGENTPADTEPSGYSAAKDLSEKNNYKTKVVAMIPKAEIPADCTIVVVGGPKRDYLQPAVDAIKAYVENGGRALIMLDPPLKFGPGVDDNKALAGVVESWGVKLNPDVVLDFGPIAEQLGPQYVLAGGYEDHPIVRDLKRRGIATGFPTVRSLTVSKADHTTVSPMVSSSEDAIAKTDLASPKIDRSSGKEGVRTLAAAGTYSSGKENGNGRFVVVGSGDWIRNDFLGFSGNRDLYLNMLAWLGSDEDLISIRPKDPEDRRINMNARQANLLFYFSMVLIPLVIVVTGAGVWWKRR